MKKTFALMLSIAIIGASLAIPAFGAVKTGATCAKAGLTSTSAGKTFTCVKNGKKLVWNSGPAVLKSQQQSPNQNSTLNGAVSTANPNDNAFKPWSVTASAIEVNDAAQKNFRDWVNLQIKNNSNHKFILQDGVPAERAKNFRIVDNFGSQIFSQFFKGNSATVVGKDEKWVVSQLAAMDPAFNSCSYAAGNPGLTYCQIGGRFQGYVATTDSQFNASNLGVDGSSLLTHEYFHLVQNQMSNLEKRSVIKDGQSLTENMFPAWLIEGSANFVGFSVSAMAMGTSYLESRPAMLTYAPQDPSLNRNALEDYEVRNGLGNNSPTYPYITGQLATEYLVASVGFQKVLDIWLSFPETGNFEKSFEKSIGISKTEFYSLFEKERINLGLPAISWKLVCLKNTLISEIPTTSTICPLSNSQELGPNTSSSNAKNSPPAIDRSSNADGQGCAQGEAPFSNIFGTFTCTMLPNGNNLWKKAT
jgi:hypothetical protein